MRILSFFLTIAIFAVPLTASAIDIPKATCNESVFRPCICASKAPEEIQYRPRHPSCGGKAGITLTGELSNSFSVVFRDRQNRDRFPSVGYNGCTKTQADKGLAKCSAYKCQKTIRTDGSYTCCFGNRGSDKILSKVTRMTIKIRDVPGATTDPLLRVCLPLFSAKNPMNVPTATPTPAAS